MHLWLRREGILGKGAKRTIDHTDWINENAVSSVPCNIANTPLKKTPKNMFWRRTKIIEHQSESLNMCSMKVIINTIATLLIASRKPIQNLNTPWHISFIVQNP